MITPQDIQSKEFTRGVRGYKEEEVDSFLDEITIELEKLQSENRMLKDQVAQNAETLEHVHHVADRFFGERLGAAGRAVDVVAGQHDQIGLCLTHGADDRALA